MRMFQPTWPKHVRTVVTLLWCVLASAGTAYLTGAFDAAVTVRAWATPFLTVFVGAITSYYGLAKPSGAAAAIEQATSPSAARHAAPD